MHICVCNNSSQRGRTQSHSESKRRQLFWSSSLRKGSRESCFGHNSFLKEGMKESDNTNASIKAKAVQDKRKAEAGRLPRWRSCINQKLGIRQGILYEGDGEYKWGGLCELGVYAGGAVRKEKDVSSWTELLAWKKGRCCSSKPERQQLAQGLEAS